MSVSRKVPLLGAALSVALLTTACSGGGSGSDSSGGKLVEGKTFTMALATDPGTLDPTMSISSASRGLATIFYDSLVYAKDDGSFAPGLAKEWKATPSSVAFTLKKNITCSDGTPLTATDVADNVRFIADPKNGSPLLSVLVQPGTTAKADDAARVVTVTTPKPDGLLLGELSGMFILCRSGLDNHKSVVTKAAGTGPYTLDEAVPDDHYTFSPRKDYAWGPDGQKMTGKGIPKSINVRIIPNESTIANLLRSGEVNLGSVTGPDAKRIPKGFKTLNLLHTSGEMWFNENPGHPTADPAVREALVTGIDRENVAKVTTGGTGQPSKGLITLPPNPCIGTDTVGPNLPKFNTAKAQQILDDAGWVVGSDGIRAKGGKKLEVKFIFITGSNAATSGMELLASNWKKIGVKVTSRAMPDAQLSDALFGTGSWDATNAPFTFNLPSQLIGFVSGPALPKGTNFANIQNEGYTSAVKEAKPLVDKKSCPAWNRAEESLVKAFNPAPLFDDAVKSYYTKAELQAPGLQIWGSSIRMHSS